MVVKKKSKIKTEANEKVVNKKIARKIKCNIILGNELEANMPEENSTNIINKEELKNNVLYSWYAPEFLYNEKPKYWHILIYSTVLILILAMVVFKQWFAIPVFILIGILVFQYSEVKPRNINVSITDLGILISNKFYPFSEIKTFWILYKPPLKQINLELTKRFSPIISILLEDADPITIKDLLSPHIIQDSQRSEDLLDKFIRMLRF